MSNFITTIFTDLKQRFGNAETIGGLYLISVAVFAFLLPTFLQTILIVGVAGYGVFKVFRNPILQEEAKIKLVIQKLLGETPNAANTITSTTTTVSASSAAPSAPSTDPAPTASVSITSITAGQPDVKSS